MQDLKKTLSRYWRRILRRVEDKNAHVACCLPCHFDFEEKNIFPLLPLSVAARLQLEHNSLLALGNPKDLVEQHAIFETEQFIKYDVPIELLDRIRADHLKFAIDNNIDVDLTKL